MAKPQYDVRFLSELYRTKSTSGHNDFLLSINFIWERLDALQANAPSSQFNRTIRWIKRLVPRKLLPLLLFFMRYDAMIGFKQDEQKREVYGMLSFQKHPRKHMIGVFDIYVKSESRNKDLVTNFTNTMDMVYQLTQSFKNSGYQYLQCGNNTITQKLLRSYEKTNRRNNRDCSVNIEKARIYL